MDAIAGRSIVDFLESQSRVTDSTQREPSRGEAQTPSSVAPVDEVDISDQARFRFEGESPPEEEEEEALASTELSEEEQKQVEQLRQRDQEVRAHEQAHKSVLGAYGGAIQYDYETGPDSRSYAVGGEVSVDMSEVPNDAAATIRKMQIIARAALAPAEPSPQDYRVRAEAGRLEQEARTELREEQAQETEGDEGEENTTPSAGPQAQVAEIYQRALESPAASQLSRVA